MQRYFYWDLIAIKLVFPTKGTKQNDDGVARQYLYDLSNFGYVQEIYPTHKNIYFQNFRFISIVYTIIVVQSIKLSGKILKRPALDELIAYQRCDQTVITRGTKHQDVQNWIKKLGVVLQAN